MAVLSERLTRDINWGTLSRNGFDSGVPKFPSRPAEETDVMLTGIMYTYDLNSQLCKKILLWHSSHKH